MAAEVTKAPEGNAEKTPKSAEKDQRRAIMRHVVREDGIT
jgi:hypothetical protein